VVGPGALEDLAFVGGAADLEGLAVEVFAAEGQALRLRPQSVRTSLLVHGAGRPGKSFRQGIQEVPAGGAAVLGRFVLAVDMPADDD